MSARTTLEPLPSCVDLPPLPVASKVRTAPFVWCADHRLLCCPWERTGSKQRLDEDQERIIAVVAKAVLSERTINSDRNYWNQGQDAKLTVWWISASGTVLSTSSVPEAWWRARVFRHVTLQVEPA